MFEFVNPLSVINLYWYISYQISVKFSQKNDNFIRKFKNVKDESLFRSIDLAFMQPFISYISDVLLWTPTYGRAKAGRPARTYIQQLCEDTGCSPEDLPEAMNYREKWRERVRDIRATSTTWWWWWWWYLTPQCKFLIDNKNSKMTSFRKNEKNWNDFCLLSVSLILSAEVGVSSGCNGYFAGLEKCSQPVRTPVALVRPLSDKYPRERYDQPYLV